MGSMCSHRERSEGKIQGSGLKRTVNLSHEIQEVFWGYRHDLLLTSLSLPFLKPVTTYSVCEWEALQYAKEELHC